LAEISETIIPEKLEEATVGQINQVSRICAHGFSKILKRKEQRFFIDA
jgi:hypothetical protein